MVVVEKGLLHNVREHVGRHPPGAGARPTAQHWTAPLLAQDSVERTVLQLETADCANRVARRMDGAKSLLQRQVAFRRPSSSRRASVSRPSTVARSRWRQMRPSRRAQSPRRADCSVARENLDAVGHRIEPGRGGERRRQPEREFRIANDALLNEVRADDPKLAVVRQRLQGCAPTSGPVPAVVGTATEGPASQSPLRAIGEQPPTATMPPQPDCRYAASPAEPYSVGFAGTLRNPRNF